VRGSRRREGWGVGRGCPLPTGGGVVLLPTGEGAAPSPEKFLILALNMVSFGAFLMIFFTVQLPVLHAKPGIWCPSPYFLIFSFKKDLVHFLAFWPA